ncbi:MAG: hypothetical protein RL660_1297 [Bacteroidota bacterium]|jgi:ribose-phosphate pyrophosphokinase
MNLNLDRHFKPLAGEEISFDAHLFSGGEPHIKITSAINESDPINVTHRLNSFNDLGLLCVAVDALKRMGATLDKLLIPYFPAARQDRVMQPGEALTVKVYTDIINAFGFNKVFTYDAHSDVTAALLQNCTAFSNHKFIDLVISRIGKKLTLISPDGGALKKIYKLSEHLDNIEVVECSKHRNTATGKLTEFKVYAESLNGRDCLIVDDICDGGGTFIGLAEVLKAKGAGEIFLAVSHGIFSKGFDSLSSFSKIFTTDSVQDISNDKVVQIKLNECLPIY